VKDDTNDTFLKPSCQPPNCRTFLKSLCTEKMGLPTWDFATTFLARMKKKSKTFGFFEKVSFSSEDWRLTRWLHFKYPFCKNKLIFKCCFFSGWFNTVLCVCGVLFEIFFGITYCFTFLQSVSKCWNSPLWLISFRYPSFLSYIHRGEKVKSSFQFFNDPLCMLKSACAAL